MALRRPWQYPYADRVIGSIRRDALAQVIGLDEQPLRRVLRSDGSSSHHWRTHRFRQLAEVGGLHHHYERRAACVGAPESP